MQEMTSSENETNVFAVQHLWAPLPENAVVPRDLQSEFSQLPLT